MDRTAAPRAQVTKLPGLPRTPLDPEQQILALRRVQEAAEKRVKLGMQLYRAAESQTARQHSLYDEFKMAQQQLKKEIQEDVARSLQSYDQWVGKLDDDFNHALKNLEQRIERLQAQWDQSQKRIGEMMQRSETMLDQSRMMVGTTAKALASVQAGLKARTVERSMVAADAGTQTLTQAPPVELAPAAEADEDVVTDGDRLYQQIIDKLDDKE
ncbi:MAG: hypothetical protein CMJ18_24825 [Phycisphaeraceae bacterium]|nr:hypothetical protein [Phycisphaeraceae bacterium]